MQRTHEYAIPMGEVPFSASAGTVVFRAGDPCAGLLVLSSGSIKVSLTTDAGRQMTLYRLGPNDVCALSTQCLLDGASYQAEGVAETDVRGRVTSPAEFDRRLASDPNFRRWLFRTNAARVTDLVLIVEDLLGPRVDGRLAAYLAHSSGSDGRVHATHEAIAVELGTAREVVSRHLKDFERRGAVRLGRGSIEILSADLLPHQA